MKKLVFIIGLAFTATAFALVAGPMTIVGKTKSFDGKTVVVETEQDLITIPRNLVAQKKLATGDKIEVLLSPDEIKQLKFEPKKK
jgi:hypothetical protein